MEDIKSNNKSKIVVLGEEDFTLGFELVGIESNSLDKIEDLLRKESGIGIIIISQKDYDTLSIKIKNQIDKLIKPIVVILSDSDIKGNNLRNAIIKALGVDLMK